MQLLCSRKDISPASAPLLSMQEYRQQQFDLLADGVRRALDMNALYAAMGLEGGTPYDTATPSARRH